MFYQVRIRSSSQHVVNKDRVREKKPTPLVPDSHYS